MAVAAPKRPKRARQSSAVAASKRARQSSPADNDNVVAVNGIVQSKHSRQMSAVDDDNRWGGIGSESFDDGDDKDDDDDDVVSVYIVNDITYIILLLLAFLLALHITFAYIYSNALSLQFTLFNINRG